MKDLKEDILRRANLSEFPEKADGNTVWVRAIAKIKKNDGNTAYAILQREPNMEYTFISVNGSTSGIASVEEIYPYIKLNKRWIKGFRGNATEPRIKYLKSLDLPYAQGRDYSKMSFSELNKEIVGAAIYLQIRNELKNE